MPDEKQTDDIDKVLSDLKSIEARKDDWGSTRGRVCTKHKEWQRPRSVHNMVTNQGSKDLVSSLSKNIIILCPFFLRRDPKFPRTLCFV